MSTKSYLRDSAVCLAVASALLISAGCCGGRTATHRYCCHTGRWIPLKSSCCSGNSGAPRSSYFAGCDSGASQPATSQPTLEQHVSNRKPPAEIAASRSSILNSQDLTALADADAGKSKGEPQVTCVPEEIVAQPIETAKLEVVATTPPPVITAEPKSTPAVAAQPPATEKVAEQKPIEFEVEVIEKAPPITAEQLVDNDRYHGDLNDAWRTGESDAAPSPPANQDPVAPSVVTDFNEKIVLRAKVVQPLIRPLPDDTRVADGRRLTPAKPVGYGPLTTSNNEPYGGNSLKNVEPAPLRGLNPGNTAPRPMLAPPPAQQPDRGMWSNSDSALLANPQSSEINFQPLAPGSYNQQLAQPIDNNNPRR